MKKTISDFTKQKNTHTDIMEFLVITGEAMRSIEP